MKNLCLVPLFMSLLFSSSSFATYHICEVEKPCLYEQTGLGFCLGLVDLKFSKDFKSFEVLVQRAQGTRPLFPKQLQFSARWNSEHNWWLGGTEDGDTWIRLAPADYSTRIEGVLVVDQDFPFMIQCKPDESF